jgi:multidrug efflux pump subunit AcrA (membrane-fusion protein)
MPKTILFLITAVCWLATCGCSKKEEAEAKPVTPVQVTPVREASIRHIVTADGVLYPVDQASVMPKVSAPVEKFLVNRGDHVRQGQLLAILESRDLAGAAAESKGQLDQAEASYRLTSGASLPEEITKSQGDVDAARQAMDAAQKLVESRQKLFTDGAIARKLVDEAQVAYITARSQSRTAESHLKSLQGVSKEGQLKSAAAQVDAAKGHSQTTAAQLGYAQIHSPIDGVISERPLYAGEMASAGAPLLTVMDISRVVARVNVPLDQASFIAVGQAATVALSDGSIETPGKVIVVSPAADAGSTTVQVWVQAENPGERLKPGRAVRVSIVAATLPKAVVVPVAALLPSSEGGVAVMAVTPDSVAHQKSVKTGLRDGDEQQILEGVAPGEQVVVVGGVGLEDGAKVKIEKPSEKSGKSEEK